MRKWMRTIGTTLAAVLCSAAMVLPGFAAGNTEEGQTEPEKTTSYATVSDIPISIAIEGEMPEDPETFHVVMEADSDDAAGYLPGEAASYTIDVSRNKEGKYEATLPEMKFDRVGIYYYNIWQEQGEIPWAEYDEQAYRLKVTVTNKEGSETGELEITAVLRYADTDESKDNKLTTVAFTNTYKVGSLTVSKTVDGNKADAKKEFTFTLTLTMPEPEVDDKEMVRSATPTSMTINYGTLLRKANYDSTAINGEIDGVTFVNGVGTFTLKHGECKTFTQLPAGTTYKVVESDSDYTAHVKVNDKEETKGTSAEGTITYAKTDTVAFRNTKNGSDPTPTPTPDPITKTTNIAVGKVWEDNDNADGIRPESVTVQLYRNGEAYGNPVTLNEANKWWYRWDYLDENATWTVDELNVPAGYEKSFTKNAVNAWVIINTHEATVTPVPQATDGTSHTNAYTGDESNMLLWLVLMVAAGAGAVAGIVIYRKRRQG